MTTQTTIKKDRANDRPPRRRTIARPSLGRRTTQPSKPTPSPQGQQARRPSPPHPPRTRRASSPSRDQKRRGTRSQPARQQSRARSSQELSSRKRPPQRPPLRTQNDRLKIYLLGGNEEVGRNCTVFEYGNDIVILDIGLQFPEEDMPGVDYIIPNIESLKGKEKNIRGVVLTHGHLDHIGAIPYILPKLGNPTVIGSDMTLALVKRRWEEFNYKTKLNTISVKKTGESITLGKFKIEFFSVAHSVLEAFGVVVQTPFVNVIHFGDWRYDLDPVEGPPTSYKHLAKWNTKTIPSIAMFESLGALKPGHQKSEKEVDKANDHIIQNAPGRVIFATFSSALERVGQVMRIAEKHGRKIAIDGYSMKASVEIGKQFGFINTKPTSLVDINKTKRLPDNKLCIVCTGSQADERSVLVRIANQEHRSISIQPDDTIVFSSSIIPGNERSIQRLKDSLYRQGANVIHIELMNIHSGGHACQEDIKLLLNEVRPKYVAPVFANHYFLREAEKLALGEGYKKDEVFVLDNGQILEFTKRGPRLTEDRVPTDYVFVDGLGVGDVSHIVLRDRQMLAGDGMVVVIATIRRRDGKLVQNPDIISRGFIYLKENKDLVEDIRRKVKRTVMQHYDPRTPAQDMYLKNKIRNDLGQFIFTKTERRPMILPVIIEV